MLQSFYHVGHFFHQRTTELTSVHVHADDAVTAAQHPVFKQGRFCALYRVKIVSQTRLNERSQSTTETR